MFRFPKQMVVLLLLFSGLLLSGCKPITPTPEPIILESVAPKPIINQTSLSPSTVAITATTPITTANTVAALLLPTATLTTIRISLPLPTPTPTRGELPTVSVDLPITPTAEVVTPTVAVVLPLPTDTLIARPVVKALNSLNVRNGPGTDYWVVNTLAQNAQAEIAGKNVDASWWQITLADGTTGWVYAPLVEVSGDSTTIAFVDAPLPPPTATATSLPPVEIQNTPQPVVAESTPAEATFTVTQAAPDLAAPDLAAPDPATPNPATPNPVASAPEQPSFRVIEKRLWDVFENGGTLDGESVKCGEKRQLVVVVVDQNGVRLNGVAVQEEYGAREILVTGSQGRGDGAVEYILGSGQDVSVIRDVDGRGVTSEIARGMVTRPDVIPFETLIAGRYCTDDASCASFVATAGCWGHYSWTVIFQRNY